jgi:tetratricopeptide (TPR) repeat protein
MGSDVAVDLLESDDPSSLRSSIRYLTRTAIGHPDVSGSISRAIATQLKHLVEVARTELKSGPGVHTDHFQGLFADALTVVLSRLDVTVQLDDVPKVSETPLQLRGLAAQMSRLALEQSRRSGLPAREPMAFAAALNNHSIRLGELGENELALAAATEALEIRERALVQGEPILHLVASVSNNRALLLYRLGRFDDAYVAALRAVEIYRSLGGTRTLQLARALNNLGLTLEALMDLSRSASAFEECLRIRRSSKELGIDQDAWIARVMTNLSGVYARMGDADRARSIALDACALYDKAVQSTGTFDGDQSASLHNLAARFFEVGDHGSAEELLRRAITTRRRLIDLQPFRYGEELALSLALLASVLSARGNLVNAFLAAEEALGLRMRFTATSTRNQIEGTVCLMERIALDDRLDEALSANLLDRANASRARAGMRGSDKDPVLKSLESRASEDTGSLTDPC